jgi:hypothetical protein
MSTPFKLKLFLLPLLLTVACSAPRPVAVTEQPGSPTLHILDAEHPQAATLVGRPSESQPAIGRAISCLRAFRGRVYAGFGDWTDNTGPIPIVAYDPDTSALTSGPTLNTEAIDEMRVIGDALYVPEVDHGGWFWFHSDVHVFDGREWASMRLRRAVHVFDVAEFKGRVYVAYQHNPASSSEGYHRIAVFEDGRLADPAVFEKARGGRLWRMVACGDWLYVFTQGQTSAYRSNGSEWRPWTPPILGPDVAIRSESDGTKAIVIRGSLRFSRPDGLRFTETSAFCIDAGGAGHPLDPFRMPVDVKRWRGKFYVLDRVSPSANRILSSDDLVHWQTELQFQSDSPPTSMERLHGDYYIGLQNGELWRLAATGS